MSKFLVQGPDAEAVLGQVCAADVAVPVGRIVYTQWLDTRGRINADLTVTRLADDTFLVVTADLTHRRVPAWIRRATPEDAFLTVTDVTSGSVILSIQGPRSRELLGRLTTADLSNEAFPYLTAQHIEIGYAPVLALRVTYVGELGWELHVPTEYAPALYDQLRESGTDLGYRNAGMAALSSLRLEKGYRDFGHDIDNEDTPYEVGLGFAVELDKPGGFIGRDALLERRAAGPVTRRLAQFLLDDPAYDLLGDEPIYRDDTLVGYLRAGAFGYTLGASVGLGMIESWSGLTTADITSSHFEIDIAGTRVGARASLRPLYDPDRVRPTTG
jgi:4-methylaminobutanoate oxidase (formaldehyde-forming)